MIEATIEILPLSKIRTDGGTQTRVGNDPTTIEDYTEAMKMGAAFPPLLVIHDKKARAYWLVDGFHRYHAAKGAQLKKIACEVRAGTQREALLLAVGANTGLRRSNEDKRKSVRILVRDAEWSQWSDAAIANHAGVSRPLVKALRAELAQLEEKPVEPRKGADGKVRDTSKIAEANRARAAQRVTSDGAQEDPGEGIPEYQADEPCPECTYVPCQCGEAEDPGAYPDRFAGAVAAAEASGEEVTHVEREAELAEEDDLPDELRELFAVLAPAAAIGTSLRLLVGKWRALVENVTAYYKAHPTDEPRLPIKELGELDVLLGAKGVKTLEHVAYRVAELAPEEVCEKCDGAGVDADGVKCCGGRGWLSHGELKERRRGEERAAEHAA